MNFDKMAHETVSLKQRRPLMGGVVKVRTTVHIINTRWDEKNISKYSVVVQGVSIKAVCSSYNKLTYKISGIYMSQFMF